MDLLRPRQFKEVSAGDPCLAALEELAQDMGALPEDEQVLLHFGLAKAYQDSAVPERGFAHLLEGNALKRRQTAYDEAATLEAIGRIGSAFTPELLRAHRGGGDPSSLPIFILGMPRSGSTLVEQILASHPQVFAAGERLDFGEALRIRRHRRHGSLVSRRHANRQR